MNSAAILKSRVSSVTLSPYPLLISTVVVPWARSSAIRDASSARNVWSSACLVAVTVPAMPPPS